MYTKEYLKENTSRWIESFKENSDLPIEQFIDWDFIISYMESVNKIINE